METFSDVNSASNRHTAPPIGESPREAIVGGDRVPGIGPVSERISPRMFFHSFWSLGFVSLSALFFHIVLTRILRIDEVGHIRVVRTVIEFCAIPAALGMTACIAKHIADVRTPLRDRNVMFWTGAALGLAASMLISFIVLGIAVSTDFIRDTIARKAVAWLIFILPVLTLTSCALGFLQGTGRIKQLAYAQATRSVIMITLGVLLAWAFGFLGWAAGRVLTEIGALVFAFFFFLRPERPRFRVSLVKPFLGYGGFIALTQTLEAVIPTADILTLDFFRNDPIEIAQYGIAILIFSTALLGPYAFTQSQFSRMVAHAHDPQRTWENFKHYSGVMLVLITPAAVAGYFAAPLVGWIFGPGYEFSGIIFQWLLPAYIIKSTGTVAFDIVAGAGRVRSQFAASLTTAILNVLLNLWLVPGWGVQGTIIATTASYASRSILSVFILWNYQRKPAPNARNV